MSDVCAASRHSILHARWHYSDVPDNGCMEHHDLNSRSDHSSMVQPIIV